MYRWEGPERGELDTLSASSSSSSTASSWLQHPSRHNQAHAHLRSSPANPWDRFMLTTEAGQMVDPVRKGGGDSTSTTTTNSSSSWQIWSNNSCEQQQQQGEWGSTAVRSFSSLSGWQQRQYGGNSWQKVQPHVENSWPCVPDNSLR